MHAVPDGGEFAGAGAASEAGVLAGSHELEDIVEVAGELSQCHFHVRLRAIHSVIAPDLDVLQGNRGYFVNLR